MSLTEHELAIMAVVRRNTAQVQGQGDFALVEELFADDFVDRTPLRGTTPIRTACGCCITACAMRFRDSRIVEHWGVANLFSLVHQLGARIET